MNSPLLAIPVAIVILIGSAVLRRTTAGAFGFLTFEPCSDKKAHCRKGHRRSEFLLLLNKMLNEAHPPSGIVLCGD